MTPTAVLILKEYTGFEYLGKEVLLKRWRGSWTGGSTWNKKDFESLTFGAKGLDGADS